MKRVSCRVRGLGFVAASGVALLLSVSTAAVAAQGQPAAAAPKSATARPVLDKYCVTCHNQRLKTAGLSLDTADLGNVSKDGVIWEKVIRKMRTGAMPPVGVPRP